MRCGAADGLSGETPCTWQRLLDCCAVESLTLERSLSSVQARHSETAVPTRAGGNVFFSLIHSRS